MEKAQESRQVQKAREKITKKHAEENQKMDQWALEEMKQAIRHRIDRFAKHRIPLSEKTFSLTEEDKPIAKVQSKFVKTLESELRKESEASPAFKKLIGRIKQ